jgi:hypothetical protein
MINFQDAELIADSFLRKIEGDIGVPLQIIKTQELSYGWLFFYNSREYVETGEFSSMLAGNAPFVVDAFDGALHILGTAFPIEFYLMEYETARMSRVPSKHPKY